MLEMRDSINKVNFDVVMLDKKEALRWLKVLRWHNTNTKAKREAAKQEALELLQKYNYSEEEIAELMIAAGFEKAKVVKLPVDNNKKKQKEAKNHIDFLHNHDHKRGWVCLAHIDGSIREDGWVQYHYWNDKVATEANKLLNKQTSTYISINEFHSPMRNTMNVRYMTAFYVDIDAHGEEEVDLKAIKRYLNKKYKAGMLPKHSRLTATGRGVQVYWKLELVPGVLYWMWKSIEEYFVEALEDVKDHIKGHEVDKSCTDVARVFRLEGTYNPKAKADAYCVEKNDNVYRMSDVLETYFSHKVKVTKTKATEGDITSSKGYKIELSDKAEQNFKLTRQRRINDLRMLLELRKNQIMQGHREWFLWVYVWQWVENITSERMIYKELASVNEMFKDPLPEREVRALAKKTFKKWSSRSLKETALEGSWSAKTGRYCLKNKTIIERLDISEYERSHFETIFLTQEEAEKVWNERRNAKKKDARRTGKKQQTKREKGADNVRRMIQRHKAKGLSQKEVAEKMGLSLRTVKTYWN